MIPGAAIRTIRYTANLIEKAVERRSTIEDRGARAARESGGGVRKSGSGSNAKKPARQSAGERSAHSRCRDEPPREAKALHTRAEKRRRPHRLGRSRTPHRWPGISPYTWPRFGRAFLSVRHSHCAEPRLTDAGTDRSIVSYCSILGYRHSLDGCLTLPGGQSMRGTDISWENIRRWRARAKEPRALADQFTIPSAQDGIRRAAAKYDKLADDAEARLRGWIAAPSK